ncbi:MAG TPA: HAD-IA family hydrolase [Hyphomicrobiales bacterium]|nr:HAD-IA family hydrolase [Hyphomicrobiales bacterium]
MAVLLGDILGAGLRCCVASSASPEKLDLVLRLTGLRPYVAPNVFSSRMVARGKPAPDIFLHAAAQMGIAPERSVVVEDSVAGIEGALAAGMRAFGFCGGSHCLADHGERLHAAGADAICPDAAGLRLALLGERPAMANA